MHLIDNDLYRAAVELVLWDGALSPTFCSPETSSKTPALPDVDIAAVSRGFLPATHHPDGDVPKNQ
jgi:hypothetical protein